MSLTDANGQTIGYGYDEIGRQVAASHPPPSLATSDDLVSIAFAYDPNNNPVGVAETWTGEWTY